MRIMYLINALNTGGSEHQMVEAARRLQQRGHEIAVGCLLAEGVFLPVLQSLEIPVIEFSPHGNLMGARGISALLRLAWYLRRHRFQVVHAHDLYSNLLGIPASWLARAPRIISSRRDLASWWWYTPRNRAILRNIQSLSHAIVANSAAVRDFLVTKDGFKADKVWVLHNGIDVERFRVPRAARQRLFPQLSGKKLIITVANMHTHTKGHQHLIAAAETVCRSIPSAVFVLAGDGELRSLFEDEVRQRKLTGNFVFLGARHDVPELLACCDAAVLASVAEGLPNVVLEYMAAGLPVVATAVGGVPEVIENGRTGWMVPPADATAMAKALIHLLTDSAVASRIAQAGQAEVRQRFSYERLIAELETLYSCRALAKNPQSKQEQPLHA